MNLNKVKIDARFDKQTINSDAKCLVIISSLFLAFAIVVYDFRKYSDK